MKRVLSILLVLIMTFAFATVCFAAGDFTELCKIADTDDVATLSSATHIGTDEKTGASDIWKHYFRMNGATLELANIFFEERTSKQLDAIQDFVNCLNSWEIETFTKQAIYTSLYDNLESDVVAMLPDILDAATADMTSALVTYWQIKDEFQFFLGVLVIVISLLLVASTVIDLTFLMSPSLMGNLMETVDSEGKTKWFISKDAVDIAKMHALNGDGEPIYFSYFKRRWLTYLILALCLFMLLTGGIGRILEYIFSIVGNVTDIT